MVLAVKSTKYTLLHFRLEREVNKYMESLDGILKMISLISNLLVWPRYEFSYLVVSYRGIVDTPTQFVLFASLRLTHSWIIPLVVVIFVVHLTHRLLFITSSSLKSVEKSLET